MSDRPGRLAGTGPLEPPLFVSPVQGSETDERYTPKSLFDALGVRFDLDPASPGDGLDNVPADSRYTAADDGLSLPWFGLVWLNPPFSNPAPWVDRWIEHGHGVLLFPWSVNASWRQRLIGAVTMVVLLEHLRFESPTHTGRHVPVACALTAIGADGLSALTRYPWKNGPIVLFTDHARELTSRCSAPDGPDQ